MNVTERIAQLKEARRIELEQRQRQEEEEAERYRQQRMQELSAELAEALRYYDAEWLLPYWDGKPEERQGDDGAYAFFAFNLPDHRPVMLSLPRVAGRYTVVEGESGWAGYRIDGRRWFETLADALMAAEINDDIEPVPF